MSDDPDVRYRKAKETLDNIGWVFDAFVKVKMGEILESPADDTKARETAAMQAKVAMELKGALVAQVKNYEDTLLVQQKRQEARNGGRDEQPIH